MEQLNSKILLFGEYAILHEGMALVMPYDKYHGSFEFTKKEDKDEIALQSNEYLRRFSEFVSSRMDEKFVLEVKRLEKELDEGLFFRSNIPQGYGLGSSGALVAALVLRYLVKAKHFKDEMKVLTIHKIRELKSALGELESHFHGVSSGLDPLSSILNEPILYKNQQEIITAKLPLTSSENENVIFLLDSNCPRTTSNMMNRFSELYGQEDFNTKFNQYVINDNNETINNFLNLNVDAFYDSLSHLSAFQSEYMRDFFPEHLHKDLEDGLKSNDYYLKLCGAGGGGYVLGFTRNWEATQAKLKDYQIEEIYRY
ncbi:MAG TPA: hypothetical protein VL021_10335 [Brumimicrobium sp.]|nr:hypothetical protein [Brumimicrobium sp.]